MISLGPPLIALYAIWVLWAVSWLIAALWADRTVARPAATREWRYRPFTFAGWALLLFHVIGRVPPSVIDSKLWALMKPLWILPVPIAWLFVALAAAGCSFAWWGRIYLGRLWSASLTAKADHRVIDTGPYAIVRHPIYTGLLMSALATLAIRASPAVIAGFAIFTIGYWIKAREEERFLSGQLGPDAYAAYRARVPMLVPYWPR